MAAGKRKAGESFDDYRLRLKKEQHIADLHCGKRVLFDSNYGSTAIRNPDTSPKAPRYTKAFR